MPNFLIFLYLGAFKISCSIELSLKKSFITSGAGKTHTILRYEQSLKIRV